MIACPTPFAQAATYRDLSVAHRPQQISDQSKHRFPWSERHLQSLWYDARWRPKNLVTHCGEPVEVLFPGRWNLEEGPDFRDAVLRIGHQGLRMVGDVEIHVRAADWRAHGHTGDPNYDRVRLHVTWFDQPLPTSDLPPGCWQMALEPHMREQARFTFDQLDLTAYPYDIDMPLMPLREFLSAQSPTEQRGFLDAAGEERLRSKTERFAEHIDAAGAEQALYAGLLEALGYKQNRLPMRELARRLPVGDVRAVATSPDTAYALLLGVAGLLPESPGKAGFAPPASAHRLWWDHWWQHEARWSGRILESAAWRLGTTRPTNHPRRRLRAMASWLNQTTDLTQLLADPPPSSDSWVHTMLDWLEVPAPYDHGPALVGRPRAAAILTNILVPFAAATGVTRVFEEGALKRLPVEPINGLMRQTAHALFGPDHSPSLYRSALQRQGLLQVFYDYGCSG